jgi:hypothetical protein
MRARVAKYPPRTTFHTASEEVFSETRHAPVLCAEDVLRERCIPQSPEHPLLQDAVLAGAFTAEKLPREEGEVVLGYRVQIPAL